MGPYRSPCNQRHRRHPYHRPPCDPRLQQRHSSQPKLGRSVKTDDVKFKFNPVHQGAVKTAWKPKGLNHAERRKIFRNNDPKVLMRRLQIALEAVRLQQAHIAQALGEAADAQCQATASAQELKDAHARIRAQTVQVDVLQEELYDVERNRNDLLRDIELLNDMADQRPDFAVSLPVSDKLKINVAGDFKTPAECAKDSQKLVRMPGMEDLVGAEARSKATTRHFLMIACNVKLTAEAAGISVSPDADLFKIATDIVDKAQSCDFPLKLIGTPPTLSIHTGSTVHATMSMCDPFDLSRTPLLWSSKKVASFQESGCRKCEWITNSTVYDTQPLIISGVSRWGPARFRPLASKGSACCGQGQIGLFPINRDQ